MPIAFPLSYVIQESMNYTQGEINEINDLNPDYFLLRMTQRSLRKAIATQR